MENPTPTPQPAQKKQGRIYQSMCRPVVFSRGYILCALASFFLAGVGIGLWFPFGIVFGISGAYLLAMAPKWFPRSS